MDAGKSGVKVMAMLMMLTIVGAIQDESSETARVLNKIRNFGDLYDLPGGWSVFYNPDELYAGRISGVVFGPADHIRAEFLVKMSSNGDYFSIWEVEETHLPSLDSPLTYLEGIMSERVYDSWVRQLRFLLEEDGCCVGEWRSLQIHACIVRTWYSENDNMDKIKVITEGIYKNSKEGERFRQFLEMFADNRSAEEVIAACRKLSSSLMDTCTGSAWRGIVYRTWNEQTRTRRLMQ